MTNININANIRGIKQNQDSIMVNTINKANDKQDKQAKNDI